MITLDDLNVSVVEYQTDVSPEATAISVEVATALVNSEPAWDILHRCVSETKGRVTLFVTMQAGIEIGLKLAANLQQRQTARRE